MQFGLQDHWQQELSRRLDPAAFSPRFGDVTSGDADCVVPFSVDDHIRLWSIDGMHGRRAWLSDPDLVRSLDDKFVANEMIGRGPFSGLIPPVYSSPPEHFPVLVKSRTGENGAGIHFLTSEADLSVYWPLVESGSHFCQAYVEGPTEFALHVLMVRGRAEYSQLVRYDMSEASYVKGKGGPAFEIKLIRHCVVLPLFEKLLKSLGYQGLCCINYKIVDDRPSIFEINPRFGYSLCFDINRFLVRYYTSLIR